MAEAKKTSTQHGKAGSFVSIVRPNYRRPVELATLVVLVIALVVLGVWLAVRNNSSVSGTPHLVIDNHDKHMFSVTDKTGNQLYKITYPENDYADFQAVNPSGSLLMSLSINSPEENFAYAVNGKSQTIAPDTAKALHSAVTVGTSHHVYFLDNNNVAYITCPDGGTCKLEELGVKNGKSTLIVDTGVKTGSIAQFPTAYILGLSSDRRTLYVRTTDSGKLGKYAGVYAVDLKGDVTGSWSIGTNAGYTPALSPDAKQIAYKTETTSTVTINDLVLSSKKTQQVKWTEGAISNTANTFVWSTDSKKVLFWGSNSILPRPAQDSTFDINMAYLDTSKNKLTNLQTIKDSAHNQLGYEAWLDSNTIIYEQDKLSQPYITTTVTPKIMTQNVSSKAIDTLSSINANLKQVIFY